MCANKVGKVISCAPEAIIVAIDDIALFEEHKSSLQVGRFLKIAQGNHDFSIATIRNIKGVMSVGGDGSPDWQFQVECQAIGTLIDDKKFDRGSLLLPVPTELAFVADDQNNQKSTLFPLEKRLEWLREVFRDYPQVEVSCFYGLTVKFCEEQNAHYLIRGLRNASDFDYEKTISQLNTIIGKEVETIFLISQPEFSHISSTIVREIIKGGGDVSPFVPGIIADDLKSDLDQPKF